MENTGPLVTALLIGATGLCLAALALRSLLTRRPATFPSWFGVVGVFFLLPETLIRIWTGKAGAGWLSILTIAWFGLCSFFVIRMQRGWSVFPAREEPLREFVRRRLANRGVAVEESMGVLLLPDLAPPAHIGFRRGLGGTTDVEIQPSIHRPFLREMARDIRREFRTEPLRRRVGAVSATLAMGAFCVLAAALLVLR